MKVKVEPEVEAGTDKGETRMPKTHAVVINWGEIEGPGEISTPRSTTLTRPSSAYFGVDRRSDETKLIQELRDLNKEEPDDDDNNYYWRLIGIAHLPRTTIVEWKSSRGHHATTQICWME